MSAHTLNPYCFPGFGILDELEFLVQSGLTPMAALQAATRNPARFMGRENELGTIEKGKLADLVLLDANPLKDITNTRRMNAVIYRRNCIRGPPLMKCSVKPKPSRRVLLRSSS